MKCKRCNRPLKNHTDSGMGEVCRMKAAISDSSDAPKPKIELIYNSRRGHRNYLIYLEGKRIFVAVSLKVIRCHFCSFGCSHCEHIRLIEVFDRENFPEDYPQTILPVSNVVEFPTQPKTQIQTEPMSQGQRWIENLLVA